MSYPGLLILLNFRRPNTGDEAVQVVFRTGLSQHHMCQTLDGSNARRVLGGWRSPWLQRLNRHEEVEMVMDTCGTRRQKVTTMYRREFASRTRRSVDVNPGNWGS